MHENWQVTRHQVEDILSHRHPSENLVYTVQQEFYCAFGEIRFTLYNSDETLTSSRIGGSMHRSTCGGMPESS